MSATPAASPNGVQSSTQPVKAEKEQITFRFCRECSNMLYAKEDRINNKLMFACRTCQYSEDASSACVFRNSIYNVIGETAGVTQDVGSDPTVGLPAVCCTFCGEAITCDFCGGIDEYGMENHGSSTEGGDDDDEEEEDEEDEEDDEEEEESSKAAEEEIPGNLNPVMQSMEVEARDLEPFTDVISNSCRGRTSSAQSATRAKRSSFNRSNGLQKQGW
ncbi:MAG: hypothetical protein Q9170_005798 [Blastenia crenularia]